MSNNNNNNSENRGNLSNNHSNNSSNTKAGSNQGDAPSRGPLTPLSGEERRKASSDLKSQQQSTTRMHHGGHKFHEVFQMKQGRYADLPAAKISEMMKSSSLDNAPTQSLLSVVNGILDESTERKNGEIPHRVVCLLRKVVQEIQRRISTQADHLRTQNNLFKIREEKYQSRISVLEALEEFNKPESPKAEEKLKVEKKQKVEEKSKVEKKQKVEEKTKVEKKQKVEEKPEVENKQKIEEKQKVEEEVEDKRELVKKESAKNILEIASLKQELETTKKMHEQRCSEMEKENESIKAELQTRLKELEEKQKVKEGVEDKKELVKKESAKNILEIASLKQELETAKKMHEQHCSEMEKETESIRAELQTRLKELEEKQKVEEEVEDKRELVKKESAKNILEISSLKQELETAKKMHKQRCSEMEKENESIKAELQTRLKELEEKQKFEEEVEYKRELMKKESSKNILEIASLKQELETAKKMHEQRCSVMEKETESIRAGLQKRLKELESLLADSRNKVKDLETSSEMKSQRWSMKVKMYQSRMDSQFGVMRELRLTSNAIKQELQKTRKSYSEEFSQLEVKLKTLADVARSYREVLAENRKLFNEIQDLKGNIRVFCRIRPFIPGQTGKQTIVDSIGENGQLVVTNPAKPGKDGLKTFKFNKVYGPAATQGDVFSDIQPFIQSVVDGYNVCIFAYGQTGSGKTYTMSGPNDATEEEWGVNYRALNNLFGISQTRRSTITYEVGVQMVEIYNEQVRDLLSSNGPPKKMGITNISQPNGLAVPDASMHPVLSTSDVIELIDIGFKNRTVSATALNERSSRSHSIVTVHVQGKDMKAGSSLFGNLHLVDLAGSERVDRSEVTGSKLKEAQHINKSLSALGDVIFALAQKSSHVPYRNSKLTQVLQSSLGGQAKTLMFVQLNPDSTSYSESLSTLKFAERVSGVELGAARSSKDGKDVKELMEQMASLKDTIAKKDEEIERLHLLKDIKNGHPAMDDEQQGTGSLSDEAGSDDEKLSEKSDGAISKGTGTDGSADYTHSPEGLTLGKAKVVSRFLTKTAQQGQTTSKVGSPKTASPAIKKSLSSNSMKPPGTPKKV